MRSTLLFRSCAFAAAIAFARATTQAGTVVDDFNVPHNYAGGNVNGTIWSGVLNPGSLAQGDASITLGGALTWNSTPNVGWEDAQDNGPVLFRTVSGDFDVSVFVGSMSTSLYSDGGIIVRAPNLGDAGSGEDYLAIRHFGALGFDATRSVDNNATSNVNYSTFDSKVRITRTGDVFDFYTRPTLIGGPNWQLRDEQIRPDLGALTDLQVGLWFGTFTSASGGADFNGFSLSAATVPEPSSLVLAALGCAGLFAWGWRRRAQLLA